MFQPQVGIGFLNLIFVSVMEVTGQMVRVVSSAVLDSRDKVELGCSGEFSVKLVEFHLIWLNQTETDTNSKL